MRGNPELVPECHATEEVFALFERAPHCSVVVVRPTGVLDVEPQFFGEGNRIGDVPSVRGHARAEVGAIGDGDTEVRAIGNAQRPRVVEVIFRSRALDVRLLLAVDVDEIVTFAEPSGLILNHTQHGADVMTAAGGMKDFVGRAKWCWKCLAIPRVKVGRVRGERFIFRPIDVVMRLVTRRRPSFVMVTFADL